MKSAKLKEIEEALAQHKPFGLKTNYDLASAVGCGDLLLEEVRRLREELERCRDFVATCPPLTERDIHGRVWPIVERARLDLRKRLHEALD